MILFYLYNYTVDMSPRRNPCLSKQLCAMSDLLGCRVAESGLRYVPLSTSVILHSFLSLVSRHKFLNGANHNYVCSVDRMHIWVCIVMAVAAAVVTAENGNETEIATPSVTKPPPQSKHTTRNYGVTLTVLSVQNSVLFVLPKLW